MRSPQTLSQFYPAPPLWHRACAWACAMQPKHAGNSQHALPRSSELLPLTCNQCVRRKVSRPRRMRMGRMRRGECWRMSQNFNHFRPKWWRIAANGGHSSILISNCPSADFLCTHTLKNDAILANLGAEWLGASVLCLAQHLATCLQALISVHVAEHLNLKMPNHRVLAAKKPCCVGRQALDSGQLLGFVLWPPRPFAHSPTGRFDSPAGEGFRHLSFIESFRLS